MAASCDIKTFMIKRILIDAKLFNLTTFKRIQKKHRAVWYVCPAHEDRKRVIEWHWTCGAASQQHNTEIIVKYYVSDKNSVCSPDLLWFNNQED